MNLRVLLATACVATVVHAHPGSQVGPHPQASTGTNSPTAVAGPKERAARAFFSDRRLVNQHGKEVAFFSDVLKGNVVLINFVFTQCKDSCPMQSLKLSEAQVLLGQARDKDVRFVSISVDPERDTPEVLSRYADHFNAGPGWTFLTGRKENVDDVLRRLGQLTRIAEAHSTLFILGNVNTGQWIKLHPDSTPEAIVGHLNRLALQPAAGSTAGSH
jgi:protein SCO1